MNGLFKREQIPCPIILMYHAITPAKSRRSSPWSINLKTFCAQLDCLHQNAWKTIRLRDIEQDFMQKAVAITFDDGYANNMEALSELKKRNMLATWFIVTERIGFLPNWPGADSNLGRLLDRAQILEIQESGMEIGSHTKRHSRLPDQSLNELHAEIIDSKKALESILEIPVQSFAYPYGAYDDSVLQCVRQAGYRYACSTASGWSLQNCGLLNLRRITIYGDDSVNIFMRKLAFADNEVGYGKVFKYYAQRLKSKLGAS